MFHFFFAVSLASVIFSLWLIYELYKIHSYKHLAEFHYGKILKHLKEKREFLPEFISMIDCRDEKDREILAQIHIMRKNTEGENDLAIRLRNDRNMDIMIEALNVRVSSQFNSEAANVLRRMDAAKKAFQEALREYNVMASRTGEIYNKKAVRLIAGIFGIQPLREISAEPVPQPPHL